MQTIKIQKLSIEKFAQYGFYANLLNPSGPSLGASPSEYFRDIIQQNLGPGVNTVSYSCFFSEDREWKIDTAEYHNYCTEACMPIDADCFMFVAPATAGGKFKANTMEAFYIAKGTMIIIKPGIWHYAVFPINAKSVSVFIGLPERVYETDAFTYRFKESEITRVEPWQENRGLPMS